MSGFNTTNNIKYVTAGQTIVTMDDDIINCDSSAGEIILVFPNIQNAGVLYSCKKWKINDFSNTASTNNIILVGTGGNKISDASTVTISTDGQSGYVVALGLNDYLFDTNSSMVGGFVGGSGTLNYIPKWTPDGVTIGDSQIYDNGTNVGIGTTTPTAKIETRANGSTSATYSYLAKSATGVDLLRLDDSGTLYIGHLGSSIYTDAVESPSSLVIYGRDKTIFDSLFKTAVLGAKYGKQLTIHAWTGFGTSNIRFQGYSASGGGTIITEDVRSGEVGFKSSFFSGGFEHRFVNGNMIIGADAAPTAKLQVVGLPTYADNAAALAGGLTAGAFYIRTGHGLDIVV